MKINFIGYINGDSGYSVLSRSLISLMNHVGIDVRVVDLANQQTMFPDLQKKRPEGRINLLHQLPSMRPAQMYYTVTEFDQPPFGCISPMQEAQHIFTESNFCKKIFKKFVDCPVDVLSYPIDPQYKPHGASYKFNPDIEKFRFKFLAVFEWSWRKDPYKLIKAFAEEFDKDEDCCLILRSWSKLHAPRKWIGSLGKDANIFWLPNSVAFLGSLYRACNCFVTPTLGEGFGHPIAEAMACGLKVIAPKSTGIVDYCNTKNSILLPCKEKTIDETDSFKIGGLEYGNVIKPWFKCWEPDIKDLKKAMRKAYRSDMKFVVDNAVKIRDKFGLDNTLEQIKKVFNIG